MTNSKKNHYFDVTFENINNRKEIEMKLYLYSLMLLSILLIGCAGSKEAKLEMKLGSLNVSDCSNSTTLSNPAEFMGETADNLVVSSLTKALSLSFDVRTRCNAQLTAELETDGSNIKIKLRNLQPQTSDCVCFVKVTTSVLDVAAGNYHVMVTNSDGTQLLANQRVTVQ